MDRGKMKIWKWISPLHCLCLVAGHKEKIAILFLSRAIGPAKLKLVSRSRFTNTVLLFLLFNEQAHDRDDKDVSLRSSAIPPLLFCVSSFSLLDGEKCNTSFYFSFHRGMRKFQRK